MGESNPRRRIRPTPWQWALLAALVLEIAWLLYPPSGVFVERWYSQGLYRWSSAAMVAMQNAVPVSLTSLAVLAVGGVATTLAVRHWYRLRGAGRSRWRIVPWSIWTGGQFAIPLVLWMLIVWGAGYQRTPVSERWALDNAPFTAEESTRLQAELLSIILETAESSIAHSREDAVRAIAANMERILHERGDRAVRVPHRVRATPPGFFLTFGTAGMCVPAAIEPFADGAYDSVSFAQVAAHELAHVAGYNRESEATLVGYLAGLSTDNPLARYAAALDIYRDLIGRIPDPERYAAAVDALPQKAQEDLEIRREISSRYAIRVALFQRAGYQIYDTYLKSQGIDEGMINYSAGLRLFAGAWRQGLAAMAVETAHPTV